MKKYISNAVTARHVKVILLVLLSVIFTAIAAVFFTACTAQTEYSILLLDEDKTTVLYAAKVAEGDVIEGVPTPVKEADAQYTYTFSGWVDESGNKIIPAFAESDITAYATYSQLAREYGLTIAVNGTADYSYNKVVVTLDGAQLTTGASVHYGDLLQIEINAATGCIVAEEHYEGLTKLTTDGGTYYMVTGNVTISYTDEAATYTISVLNYDKTTSLGTLTAAYAGDISDLLPTPSQPDTLRAAYTFDCWRNLETDEAVDITRITSSMAIYPSFTENLIEYSVTMTDRVTVTITSGNYEWQTYTSATANPAIHYGDEYVVTYSLADGYSVNTLTANGDDIAAGETLTMQSSTGIDIVFAMEKTFTADKYCNLQSFVKFTGTSTILPSECMDNGSTLSYTYVGLDEVTYTAVYADFLQMAQVNNVTTSFTPDFSADTLTTVANLAASSYITTALYKGMTIEFTVSANVAQMIFGLSTYEDITANASTLNWYSTDVDSTHNWYCPTYNFYAAESSSGARLRRIISGYEVDVNSSTSSGKGIRAQIGNSSLDSRDTAVTIRLVLGDELELYIDGVKEELFYTNLAGYTVTSYDIAEGTAYYFSFAASSVQTVTITDFGYVENSEWSYLQYLSGKTITLLGDSVTAGFYASDFTRGQEYTGTARYSTQLAAALGMQEDNLGEAGAVYVTGIEGRQSMISDAQRITADSEIVVVLLGINDFYEAPERGEFGSLDTGTLYGAVYTLCASLAQTFAGEEYRVFICTPIPSLTDLTAAVVNANGDTLQDYCDIIAEVAAYFGFNVVDLYNNAGLLAEDYAGTDIENYANDVLHPNDSGHTKIAEYLYQCIIEAGRYLNNNVTLL